MPSSSDEQSLYRLHALPGRSGGSELGTLESPAAAAWAAGIQRWLRDSPHALPLVAGAIAGMSVEGTLFPLDSVKTRLQSGRAFLQADAFRGVYRGVGVTALGAVPASAIFFCTYETTRERYGSVLLASVVGEIAASSVRVPVDFVKQRLQVGLASGFRSAARDLLASPGSVIFASFRVSAMRDVAQSGLQYPMYEHLKCCLAQRTGVRSSEELPVWQAAACGSVAGSSSAAATTPLDVLRTRLNLGGRSAERGTAGALATAGSPLLVEAQALLADCRRSRSFGSLFAGAGCRASWMGMGGFIFLGSFEFVRRQLKGFADSAGPSACPPGPPQAQAVRAPRQPSPLRAHGRAPARAAAAGSPKRSSGPLT